MTMNESTPTDTDTLLLLLESAWAAATHAWQKSESEREQIHQLHEAALPRDASEAAKLVTIATQISMLAAGYHSISLGMKRRREFVPKDLENFSPANSSDWIDAWPILDEPKIAARVAELGDQFPNFFCRVLAVDYIRQLLIKLRACSGEAESVVGATHDDAHGTLPSSK